jgi:uncharacterized SAM-binding protein YcdF (DUF218 family)
MFFVLSKIFSYLLNPLFWIFSLLIIAYLLKNKKLSNKLFLISLIVFYLFSNRFLTDEIVRLWEIDYPSQNELNSQFEAVIVLGGGIVNYDYINKKLIFRENGDKLFQAIDLYKKKKVKKILVSGGPGHLIYRDQFEASFIKKYLINIDIPENDILVDSTSDNTFQNAINSKRILNDIFSQESRYLLITNATHMRRSIACFKKAGMHITAFPTSKNTGSRLWNFDHLFMPHLDSFTNLRTITHEMFGMLVYKIMGYI